MADVVTSPLAALANTVRRLRLTAGGPARREETSFMPSYSPSRRAVRRAAVSAGLLLALAGCGSGSSASKPSDLGDSIDVQYARACNAPEKDRTADQWDIVDALGAPCEGDSPHLADVEALRDALVAAGYPCPKYDETPPIGKTPVATGYCSDNDLFQVWDTHADVMKRIAGEANPEGSLPLTHYTLVGSNWFVTSSSSPLPDTVQQQLGGYQKVVPGSDG